MVNENECNDESNDNKRKVTLSLFGENSKDRAIIIRTILSSKECA